LSRGKREIQNYKKSDNLDTINSEGERSMLVGNEIRGVMEGKKEEREGQEKKN